MGIQVEFNPVLALRDFSECEKGNRKPEECIPRDLEAGRRYNFLKSDHRNYWLFGELPLLETKGEGALSRPRASIRIIEATHFVKDEKPYTRGIYEVVEEFDDNDIHFESYKRI